MSSADRTVSAKSAATTCASQSNAPFLYFYYNTFGFFLPFQPSYPSISSSPTFSSSSNPVLLLAASPAPPRLYDVYAHDREATNLTSPILPLPPNIYRGNGDDEYQAAPSLHFGNPLVATRPHMVNQDVQGNVRDIICCDQKTG